MTDISVIILVGREELHIRRCLERLRDLNPRQVFVVESQQGDKTHELAIETAKSLGWQTVELKGGEHPPLNTQLPTLITVFHAWPGNQAAQFNWALDNLPIEGSWILRLDADEYLTPELTEEIKSFLQLQLQTTATTPVDGVILKRRHYFAGGWAKHGTYPVRILRLFRTGHGRYAPDQVMDERLDVDGKVIELENDFVDHSLIPMSEWRDKHRNYAKREAEQTIESLRTGAWADPRKAAYYKLPRYFRAFVYFCIRYFLKSGILDGYAGWMWNFWQGLWYRCLVDYEIGKMKKCTT